MANWVHKASFQDTSMNGICLQSNQLFIVKYLIINVMFDLKWGTKIENYYEIDIFACNLPLYVPQGSQQSLMIGICPWPNQS